jgi:hypothetical protein
MLWCHIWASKLRMTLNCRPQTMHVTNVSLLHAVCQPSVCRGRDRVHGVTPSQRHVAFRDKMRRGALNSRPLRKNIDCVNPHLNPSIPRRIPFVPLADPILCTTRTTIAIARVMSPPSSFSHPQTYNQLIMALRIGLPCPTFTLTLAVPWI